MPDTLWIARWKYEEEQPFEGWDFTYLEDRMIEAKPPWDYQDQVSGVMFQSGSVLDMSTGGGEVMLDLLPWWPSDVAVTEDYPPNLAKVRRLFATMGVQVEQAEGTDDALLPFEDERFGLVLNRHAAWNSDEVARVLRPGGLFLTEQVHGMYAADLLAEFGAEPQWPDATPERYLPRLLAAGLIIEEVQEWRGELAFLEVGAIVYYLKAVPWMVPGFSVETYTDVLMRLQEQIERQGRLIYDARLYLIQAHKPA